ncbi:MAG: ABC transporter permease, partial [Mollicutes bacterium PWAP]|nr:ABC transporter permease [Mollicutes bacterium PWAP]
MWAFYKQSSIKYLKATSTWVLIGIMILIVILLGGFLPSVIDSQNDPSRYVRISSISIIFTTLFLVIFSIIFGGFKGATFIKDEIEAGTLLMYASKPISRTKMLFGKWLSLFTLIAISWFAIFFSYVISVYIFDNGENINGLKGTQMVLKNQIWSISSITSSIVAIFMMMFSSVAILISLKLSSSSTIGLMIGFGIVIPVLHTVVNSINNPNGTNNNTLGEGSVENMQQRLVLTKYLSTNNIEKQIANIYLKEYNDIANINKWFEYSKKTGTNNSFNFIAPFDIQYHIQTLTEYGFFNYLPPEAKEFVKRIGILNYKNNFQNEFIFDENSFKELMNFTRTTVERQKAANVIGLLGITGKNLFNQYMSGDYINKEIVLSRFNLTKLLGLKNFIENDSYTLPTNTQEKLQFIDVFTKGIKNYVIQDKITYPEDQTIFPIKLLDIFSFIIN